MQVMSNMVREKVGIKCVKDTLRHAQRTVGFLSNRQAEPRKPPLWSRSLMGIVCLPFAWGASKMVASATGAALNHLPLTTLAPVFTPTFIGHLVTWLPLALLCPTLTAIVLLVGSLAALVGWV
jgi:hypothetical protein